MSSEPGTRPIAPLVCAIGIVQVISWGSLFYAVGVLGAAMRADVGVSELFLFGAFTAGLLVSGALSPLAGRLVDRRGGRFVLSAGSILAAIAMTLLATAAHAVPLVLGWLVAGAAMAACLYEPAFATLSQHTGVHYRRAVTAITLFGGFASTVFWPLSHLLMEAWGWRGTLAIYAAVHLAVCLPVHLVFVPRLQGARAHEAPVAAPARATLDLPGLAWLTGAMALASFVSAVIAVHVVSLLEAHGLTPAQAISIAMLFGPMQVAGRIAEFALGARIGIVSLGWITFGLLFVAIATLIAVDGIGVAALVFVTAFGIGNGLFTIIRGTVPAQLYGRERLGAILGHLARAGLYSRAFAPASFSGLLAIGFTRNGALGALATLALAALASYLAAIRSARYNK